MRRSVLCAALLLSTLACGGKSDPDQGQGAANQMAGAGNASHAGSPSTPSSSVHTSGASGAPTTFGPASGGSSDTSNLLTGGSLGQGGAVTAAGAPNGGNATSVAGTSNKGGAGTANTKGGAPGASGFTNLGGSATAAGKTNRAGGPGLGGTGAVTGGSSSRAGASSNGGTVVTAGSSGTSATAGAPSGCGACRALEQCWDGKLCVAKTVLLGTLKGIDATEVTRDQYAAWLALKPATGGQESVCSWNDSLAPNANCMAEANVCTGANCGQHPQPCVDYCDAAAYCKALGKHLCGSIDGSKLGQDITWLENAAKSEWFNACTSNGKYQFVYGDTMMAGYCQDNMTAMDPASSTVPVGSMADCQSPDPSYAGVFDLIGNVWEWEDNCRTSEGAGDACYTRGQTFGVSSMVPDCGVSVSVRRNSTLPTTGFRCCS